MASLTDSKVFEVIDDILIIKELIPTTGNLKKVA